MMYNIQNFTDLQNFPDLFTSAYTALLGVWFYYIMIAFIAVAYYIKSNNLTGASLIFTMLSLIFSPFAMQVPLGEYAVYLTLILGIAVALSSLFLRRWSNV